ncbi:MAG TPA: adenylate/guanylate cyclase domain-containing protein [Candidatus Binatia bacterium]|nr:adenylate/guanylate cyclase domain-containing protein [Candidatus Binatia bacterium]
MSETEDALRAVARALIGEPELTAAEVAADAGFDPDQLRRIWQALGFPPVPEAERVFTRADVAALRGVRSLVEEYGIAPEVLIQLTRVAGQSLSRIAEAQVSATADRLAALRLADGADARALEPLMQQTVGVTTNLEPSLAHVWRRHLLAALLRLAATPGETTRDARTLVVGFADLVDFTALSQQLDERDLAERVDRFEALAYEHILQHGGRVVKMIGDEVMFAVDGTGAAADTALALVEAYAGDPALPDVRIGLARGPVLSWEGDLFGPTVNLASRLVNLARPGTVLVSETVAAELEGRDGFVLRPLRPLRLKGIGRTRTFVLRRAGR